MAFNYYTYSEAKLYYSNGLGKPVLSLKYYGDNSDQYISSSTNYFNINESPYTYLVDSYSVIDLAYDAENDETIVNLDYDALNSGTVTQSVGQGEFKLNNIASSEENYYNGMFVYITNGRNSGTYREITGYSAQSKTCTLASNWDLAWNGSSVSYVVMNYIEDLESTDGYKSVSSMTPSYIRGAVYNDILYPNSSRIGSGDGFTPIGMYKNGSFDYTFNIFEPGIFDAEGENALDFTPDFGMLYNNSCYYRETLSSVNFLKIKENILYVTVSGNYADSGTNDIKVGNVVVLLGNSVEKIKELYEAGVSPAVFSNQYKVYSCTHSSGTTTIGFVFFHEDVEVPVPVYNVFTIKYDANANLENTVNNTTNNNVSLLICDKRSATNNTSYSYYSSLFTPSKVLDAGITFQNKDLKRSIVGDTFVKFCFETPDFRGGIRSEFFGLRDSNGSFVKPILWAWFFGGLPRNNNKTLRDVNNVLDSVLNSYAIVLRTKDNTDSLEFALLKFNYGTIYDYDDWTSLTYSGLNNSQGLKRYESATGVDLGYLIPGNPDVNFRYENIISPNSKINNIREFAVSSPIIYKKDESTKFNLKISVRKHYLSDSSSDYTYAVQLALNDDYGSMGTQVEYNSILNSYMERPYYYSTTKRVNVPYICGMDITNDDATALKYCNFTKGTTLTSREMLNNLRLLPYMYVKYNNTNDGKYGFRGDDYDASVPSDRHASVFKLNGFIHKNMDYRSQDSLTHNKQKW